MKFLMQEQKSRWYLYLVKAFTVPCVVSNTYLSIFEITSFKLEEKGKWLCNVCKKGVLVT